jgi:hypothetical protein
VDSFYCLSAHWFLSSLAGDRIKIPGGSPYTAFSQIAQKTQLPAMLSIAAFIPVAAETCLLRHYQAMDNAEMTQYVYTSCAMEWHQIQLIHLKLCTY